MAKKKQTTIEIYRDRKGGWRFRVRAGNGEVIGQGESYTRKFDAKRGAGRLFPLAPIAYVPR